MFRIITTACLLLAITFPALVTAEQEYWEYTFRPGDTIWKIAEKYTTSVDNWSEIQKINQIRQGMDRKIRPGARIVIPVSMLKLQPVPARVIAISDNVSLIRANGDKETISTDTLLYSGDRVITGKQQSLRLQFADYSELKVLANTEVVFDKLSQHKLTGMVDTRIRLNKGSVNTWVKQQRPGSRYEIKTPTAITAVRGTAFRFSADSDVLSRTEVTEGVVVVSVGESKKLVNDGYGIVAEKGRPLSEPVKLLAAPMLSDNLSTGRYELIVSWRKVDAAIAYRYQLSIDEKFNNIIIDASTSNNITRIINLQPGHYYLRLRGVDQHKLEGFDSVARYEIKQVLPPPPPPPPPVDDGYFWGVHHSYDRWY